MYHGRSPLLAFALTLTACSASAPPESTDPVVASRDAAPRAVSASTRQTRPRAPLGASTRVPAPPGPDEIVARLARATATTNESPGQRPEYWTGHAYAVRGVPHYTGFAYASGEANPMSTAVLGQVTYLASRTGAGASWREVLVEPSIGSVGARGRAYAPDARRAVVEHATADGTRVVAVPVDGAIEQGAVPKLYDILVRSIDARWHHAGTVDAGVDDSAGCDEGRAYPCAPVKGTLTFSPTPRGLPDITVHLIGAQGPASDRYHYDSTARRYTDRR